MKGVDGHVMSDRWARPVDLIDQFCDAQLQQVEVFAVGDTSRKAQIQQ